MANKQSGGGMSTFAALMLTLLVLAGLGSCMGGGSSSTSDSAKCYSCNRTFTNSADKSSIAWRNMCENCYSNYKFSQELKEEMNKRYGN